MGDVMHTEQRNGHTIQIVHDDDHIDPRDGDCYGTFVTFDLATNGSDETIDEDTGYTCLRCDAKDDACDACTRCNGDGYMTPITTAEWITVLTREYAARLIRPVLYQSRGGQSLYTLQAPTDDWEQYVDATTIGFLIYDTSFVTEGWGSLAVDDTVLEQAMRQEIDEFNDWANGNTWGYRIIDVNGDQIESCWGYICPYDEYVLTDARAVADALPAVEPTYPVRLTMKELAIVCTVLDANGAMFTDIADKLRAALPQKGE